MKKLLRPKAQRLSLEERIVFDAALPLLAADAVDAASTEDLALHQADQQQLTQQDAPTHSIESIAALFNNEAEAQADDAERTLIEGTLAPTDLNASEIIFIDATVVDLEQYLLDRPNADVVMLDPNADGMVQIATVLENRTDIESIHILSHGSAGNFVLGNAVFNEKSMLGKHADALEVIKNALTDDGDILIYGCDLAGTAEGESLIRSLAALTGGDVAASDDVTGHADLGGDWVLEYTVGEIQTDVAFGYVAQASWFDTLATITVTTTNDENDGDTSSINALQASSGGTGISLREAIIASNNTAGADTIILGASVYTLTITGSGESFASTGDLDIRSDITITGAGSGQTTISASGLGDRIFDITSAGDLTLNALSVADANTSSSGGAINNAGVLSAYDVVIRDNTAGSSGGAILNTGDVTLERVSLYDNSATSFGGAIRQTSGTLSLTNVVVSGHSTSNHAGAVYLDGGTANVNHSTFADNVTGFNTGGFLASGASATISNSIFADNSGGGGYTDNISGNVTSLGYNILEDHSGFSANGNDITGAYSVAARTIDPTTGHAYYAITPTDAAAGAAGGTSPATNILGETRDANPDIGAGEYIPPPPDLVTTSTSKGGLSINNNGGNNTYLEANDGGAILGGMSSFTLELSYAIAQNATGENALLSYATLGDDNEVYVRISPAGTLSLAIRGVQINSPSNPALVDGERHSISISWDNQNGDVYFYIDGELHHVASGLGTGVTLNAGGNLLFGQDQDSVAGGFNSTQRFSGSLYDIRIWNEVRSEAEIAASYRSDLPYSEQGMIANWKFDQLSSDGVVLEAVSGNNLTAKHTSGTGFINSEPTLTFSLDENALDGTVVGAVSGLDAEREAQIAALLAADPDLRYSAETGKFYKLVNTLQTWSVANASASSELLNGVGGELVTIHSQHENAIVYSMAQGVGDVYIGATDSDVEGEFNWYADGASTGERFWNGDSSGYMPVGAFSNFHSGEPLNTPSDRDYVELDSSSGKWYVETSGNTERSVIQWDADAVLDATQALTYSIQSQTVAGAFAIDASTGKITVADGTLLDFETNASHTLTVRTTDVDGNTYDETFAVSLNDLTETNNAPSDLSSGIELNSDGGNDAYLVASNGGAVLGGLTELTFETSFALSGGSQPTFISYASSGQQNEFMVFVGGSGNVVIYVDGVFAITSVELANINDGQTLNLAVSWDNTNGDWAIYLDGSLADHGTALSAGQTLDAGGTLIFGQEQDAQGGGFESVEAFQGTLYDVRIWNEVRSQAEIALNHQQKFDSGSLPSGLIANWQMDGFNGSNEVVDVISGNNLTIGHATGAGFSTSAPTEDLHISETAADGTSVGFVVPSDPDVSNDIVTDGLFEESPTPGGATFYSSGQTFGDWTVRTGSIALVDTYWEQSPLGGRSVDLQGTALVGGIYQTMTTEVGRQYQVVFSLSGNWVGGDLVKNLRVSAGGESADFNVEKPADWLITNMLWSHRSFTFTADATSTDLDFLSLNAATGYDAVIADVQVIEIPTAVTTILNNDPTLSYDAATGKFYQTTGLTQAFLTAQNTANNTLLNGVRGQLVTIDSQYENDLVRDIAAVSLNWMNASDATVEGEWRWLAGTADEELFSTGSTAETGFYANWASGEPDTTTVENFGYIDIRDGEWGDTVNASTLGVIIEWDASEVLSNFTFSLTNDAGGRFAIDNNTGEITVANGSLIDFEAASSHSVTVEVTDAAGNSYSEAMSIAVDNALDAHQTVPGAQTIDEDATLTFTSGTATEVSVTDSLGGTNSRMRVTLSVNDGALILSQTTGLIFIAGANGSAAFVIDGTEADLNAALDGMTFTPDANFNGSVTLNMNTALAADLEGLYTFEGATAGDQSAGTANDGTFNGDATTVVDGTRGEVLILDGTGDYVQIASTFGNPSSASIGGWVNFTGSGRGEFISIDDRLQLKIDEAGVGIGGSIQTAPGVWNDLFSNVFISGTGWHHVMYVFDDVNDVHTLYLDGVEIASEATADSIDWAGATTTYIGRHPSAINEFTGLIDDARIYTRALSADEIMSLAAEQTEASDTVAITVNAVNDDPTNVGSLLSDVTVTEDVLSNVDLSAVDFSDIDAGGANLTVTLSTSTGGELTLAADGNLTFGGTATDRTITGTLANLNAYFNNTTNIQYLHGTHNTVGDNADTITVVINDNGNTGNGGGTDQTLGTVNVDITAVNDAPVLDDAASPTLADVSEDSGAPVGAVGTLISSLVDFASPSGQLDNVTDIDSGASLGIAVTAADTTNGTWFYSIDNGTTWTALGAVGASNARLLAADANTRLYFQADANFVGTVANAITFHAWDQTSGTNGAVADISDNTVADQFSTVSYSNNDGTSNWASDWIEVDADGGGATGGRILVRPGGDLEVRARPPGNNIYREVDLSGATSAILSFDYQNSLGSGDEIVIQASSNGGSSYTTLTGGTFTSSLNTGSGTFSLDISSFIAADTNIRFFVVAAGDEDWLYVDNVQILSPSGNTGGSTAFSSTSDTASLTITNENDAPVLDTLGNLRLPTITEDEVNNGGQTVAQILASDGGTPISDADSGSLDGIAITTRNNGRGIWEYSTDGGTNWSSVGTVSETQALLLRATDMVRFAPDGQNGNTTDRTFEFRAWDQTSGTAGTKVDTTTNGGSTAFSTAIESVSITTTDVNDAPVLDNSTNLTLNSQAEDAGSPVGAVGTVITDLVSVGGNVTDVDASSQTGVAITAADTSNGTWWYTTDSGTTWNALGAVSESSARVLNAASNTRIYFQSNADYNGTITNAITFRAWDRSVGSNGSLQDTSTNGGTSPFSVVSETADITITAVNDAPQLVGASIVANGDFQTGDLSDWTATGNVDNDGIQARFGQIGGLNGTLSQTLATEIGKTYVLSFDFRDGSLTDSQSLQIDVVGVSSLLTAYIDSGIVANTAETYRYTFVADSTSSTITFADTSADHSGVRGYLDNVFIATDAEPNAALSYTENDGPVVVDSGIVIADIDDTNIESAVIAITDNYADGEDVLAFTNQNGITGSWNASTGTLSLLGTATLAQYETAIRSITYSNTSENPSTATRTVSFTVNDGVVDSNTQTRDISVARVNDAPTNAGALPADVTVTEDVSSNVDLSAFDFSDVDAGSSDLTVTLSTSTGGNLSAAAGSGITVGGTSTSLSLTGSLTDLNNYLNVTSNVTYLHGTANLHGDNSDTITVVVNDNGNTGIGGGTDINLGTVNVDITAVNDASVAAGIEGTALAYTENDAAVAITSTISFTDVDDTNIESAVVQITGNHLSTEDVLSFSTQNGIAGVYNSTNGTLTLTGSATLAQYETAIRTITYANTSENPNTAMRTVSFTVNDGDTNSNTLTRNIAITSVNDAPVVGTNTGTTVAEGGTVTITNAMLNEADVDDSGAGLTYTVTSGPTNGQLELTTNAGVAITSFTQDDIDNNRVIFVHDGTQSTTVSFDFSLADDGQDSATPATGTFNFTVTNINDAPVLSTIEGSTLGYLEGDGLVVISNTISLGDVDDTHIESATVSITGGFVGTEDLLSFATQNGITGSYDSGTGVLTLTGTATIAEYEQALRLVQYRNIQEQSPDETIRTITFVVNDGSDNSNAVSRNVSITAVNDNPYNNGNLPSDIAVVEDQASNVVFTGFELRDVDGSGGHTLTIKLSTSSGGLLFAASGGGITVTGNNSSLLELSGQRGDLNTFMTTAGLIQYQYSTPHTFGDNADLITVIANDNGNTGIGGGTDINLGTVNVDITAVNDAPIVGTNTGATVSEGGTLTITNAMLNEADVDDSGPGLTYTVTSGPTNGQLELTTNAGVAITSFTQDDIDNNHVVFVHDGTQTNVDSFDFSLSDNGEDGATPATGTFNLTVTNVNDAPINTVPGAQTVGEDNALAITGISIADADDNLSTVQLAVGNGALNVALSGGAAISSGANGSATLTLSGPLADINTTLATLTYQGNLNFNGSDTLTVLSTDINSATDSDTVTITVNAVADAPVNTVPASVSVNEDTTVAFTGPNLISVADAESDVVSTQLTVSNGILSVTLSGSASISAGANSSNTFTVSGMQAEINATLASLTYTGNTHFNGTDTLTVLSTDATSGTPLTDADVVSITVNGIPEHFTVAIPEGPIINDAEVTSDGGLPVTINLPIDAVAGDVITLTIDGSAPISYTVTSTDIANNAASVLLPTNDIHAAGQGSAVITTTYTNAVGNSATPVITNVTIDTIAPATTVNPVGDSVKNAADVTNSAGIITVNGETGTTSVITLTGQTGAINKTLANNGTSIPVALTDSDLGILGDGLVEVSVVTTDTAGNEAIVPDLADADFILDTTAPAAPIGSLDPSSDSGINGDHLTNDNTPTISGIGGTLGDVIKLLDINGNILGTTIVGENGTWSITPSHPQPDGINTFSMTATDPVGNVSPEATITITIDTVAPVVNQMPDMTDETDTEIINDNITSTARPSFEIPAIAADERPILYIDGLIINAVYDANANTLTPVNPLMTGQYHASYRLEDAAGNLSDNSPALAFEVKNSNDVLFEQLVSDPEKTKDSIVPMHHLNQAAITLNSRVNKDINERNTQTRITKHRMNNPLDLSVSIVDKVNILSDELVGLAADIDPDVYVQNAIRDLSIDIEQQAFVQKAVQQSQAESQVRSANVAYFNSANPLINALLDPFTAGVSMLTKPDNIDASEVNTQPTTPNHPLQMNQQTSEIDSVDLNESDATETPVNNKPIETVEVSD